MLSKPNSFRTEPNLQNYFLLINVYTICSAETKHEIQNKVTGLKYSTAAQYREHNALRLPPLPTIMHTAHPSYLMVIVGALTSAVQTLKATFRSGFLCFSDHYLALVRHHWRASVLLYRCTFVLWYCCTVILLNCSTAVLIFCFTAVLMLCSSAVLKGTVPQKYFPKKSG